MMKFYVRHYFVRLQTRAGWASSSFLTHNGTTRLATPRVHKDNRVHEKMRSPIHWYEVITWAEYRTLRT